MRRAFSSPRTLRQGFTLVELMVVLAIAAILAVVAAPAFSELIIGQRARAAASALQDSLWIARSEAIKRNRSVGFELNSLDAGWTIAVQDDPDEVLLRQDGLTGLTLSASRGTPVSFVYNSQGRLANGVASLTLTISAADGAGARCIRFDAAAKPRMTAGACT